MTNQTSPFLSFCAIVKNEEENLDRCLASVAPYVDEIVVVDTGSQDNTLDIAQKYGAKIGYFPWCNDFSAARNYAISQASGHWIFMLDADHELIINSTNFPDITSSSSQLLAYLINIKDAYCQEGLSIFQSPILFRNIPELRYQGAYHEILTYNQQALPSGSCQSLESIELLHYGYGANQLEQKAKQRIALLESLLETQGFSLMLLLTLEGMSQAIKQTEKIKICRERALEYLTPYLLSGEPPEDFRAVVTWIFLLGTQSFEEQDYETTRLLCQRGLEWSTDYPPLIYLTGELLTVLGFYLGAIPYYQKCLDLGETGTYNKNEPFDLGYTNTYPAYRLGCTFAELKDWDQAQSALKLALSFSPDYAPAQEALIKIEELINP